MMMTLDKLDTGSNGGLPVSGAGRHRRHAESSTPEPMDGFYIDIPTPSTRSVSPLSASVSPGKEKSFSFFKSVYRKISLKSNDDELDQLGVHGDEDSRSSSVDSCSSISDHRDQPAGKEGDRKLQLQLSNLALSSASSDSGVSGATKRGDDGEEGDDGGPGSAEGAKENRRKSRRSSVLRLLESLAINAPMRSRSLSCSNSSVNNLLHMKGRESRAESKCSLFSTNSANNGSSGNGGERISKESSKPPPKKILRRPVSYTYLRGISGLPTQRVPRSSICCSYYGR
ncbi:uncharacterized protein LOC128714901 [Anopheles marshallii]|uniref:uncharacterized protein LOC128714901 n=1 Tax=Anopheles marshallii TaxID=1521116 RepID=UPI00237A3AC2|nr:uncharacterized protein LOC128714901 [Anopheles marshallii]